MLLSSFEWVKYENRVEFIFVLFNLYFYTYHPFDLHYSLLIYNLRKTNYD